MHLVSLLFHDVYRRRPDESGFSSPGADRYKLTLAQFAAQLDGVAAIRADAPIVAADWSNLPALDTFPFLVTVDDGGVSYYQVMADQLERRGWRGHTFVSTDFIGQRGFLSTDQIRELDARGHIVGSHSASHPSRFSACSRQRMLDEWTTSKHALEDMLGREVTIASLPGGYFSAVVADTASEAGFRVLFTSEPVTRTHADGRCTIVGRYAIRAGADAAFSRRLVERSGWTRSEEWASWHVKGLLKPVLGPLYARLADRLAPLLRSNA
jgi:peptidoglycan/xylan/chitin deacetylase (PgdA/CDA1 family)